MTKRKKALNLIATGVVVMVMALCSSCLDLPEPPPFKLASLSPQQSYAVTIERKRREPAKEDWTSWKIYLSYTAQGQHVLNEVEVAAGYFSTGPHYRERPQLNWVYENTFRVDDRASLPESESDVLFVRNDSANTLSYLCVSGDSGEWFYILNLAPQASTKLYARPQWRSGDLSWVVASGQFINGGKLSAGQNFTMPQSAKSPGGYCINVKEDEITIASRDFEGWKTAELTPEEKKQIEDYRKKLEA